MASVVNPCTTPADKLSDPDTAARVTACLFNLIVFCRDQDRLEYFRQLIQATIEHFPCRIVLIHSKGEPKTDHIESSISTLSGQGHNIVCDQLLIEASPSSLYRVPFLIWPFILPNLPLFLVWDCDPTAEQEILPQLQAHASRIIFDSETIDNLQNFSHRLLAYLEANKPHIVDLNWMRLGGWRDVLARIFDTDERLHQLRYAKSIQIQYNALENRFFHHSQTQAIYLQAWLAAQLHWTPRNLGVSQAGSEITYGHGKGEVVVKLQPEKIEDRGPGSIFSFEVQGQYHFVAKRKPGTQQVVVDISSDEECELPFTLNLRGGKLTYAFLKETLYMYSSAHYQHMLHVLKQQDWNRG